MATQTTNTVTSGPPILPVANIPAFRINKREADRRRRAKLKAHKDFIAEIRSTIVSNTHLIVSAQGIYIPDLQGMQGFVERVMLRHGARQLTRPRQIVVMTSSVRNVEEVEACKREILQGIVAAMEDILYAGGYARGTPAVTFTGFALLAWLDGRAQFHNIA